MNFSRIIALHLRSLTRILLGTLLLCSALLAAPQISPTTFGGEVVFAADVANMGALLPNGANIDILALTKPPEVGTNTVLKTPQTDNKEDGNAMLKLLNGLISFISLLYVPFSIMAGWLLSSEWTFGDVIGLRPIFHDLWVFVSNTVYVVFAGMLVVVALANIFGQGDSYAIKKMLPRFILAVIMVPFTWWAVSATLSVSSYLTALTLRLPAEIITNSNGSIDSEILITMPEKCTLDFTATGSDSEIFKCNEIAKDQKGEPLSKVLLDGNGAYGIIPLYAHNIFKFNDLKEFQRGIDGINKSADASDVLSGGALVVSSIAKIGIQLAMSALFAVIFMIILIAIVFSLFLRVMHMWMYIIFSPLFALRYFLDDKAGKDNPIAKFSFKEFVSLAMVPVVVSAALGFGFLFLMTFKTQLSKAEINSDLVKITNPSDAGPVLEKQKNTGVVNIFGQTDLTVVFPETGGSGGNIKQSINSLLAELITPILGIIVLWMVVMAAMKTAAVTGKAMEGFESVGKMAMDGAKKLPGMVPLGSVRTKNGETVKITGSGLSKVPSLLKGEFEKHDTTQRSDMRRAMGLDPGKFESLQGLVNQAEAASDKAKMREFMEKVGSAELTRDDMKNQAMLDMLTKYNKVVLGDSTAVTTSNLNDTLNKIGNDLRTQGKLVDGETSQTFATGFLGGSRTVSHIVKIGGKLEIKKDKHTVGINPSNKSQLTYKLNGEDATIKINVDQNTLNRYTTPAEKQAYIRLLITEQLTEKNITLEESMISEWIMKNLTP